MPLALPISTDDVADALFMSLTTLAGFLIGGPIGLAVGLFAGYAYLDLASRVADLEAAVNSLVRERDELRERVTELERDRAVNDRGGEPTDR